MARRKKAKYYIQHQKEFEELKLATTEVSIRSGHIYEIYYSNKKCDICGKIHYKFKTFKFYRDPNSMWRSCYKTRLLCKNCYRRYRSYEEWYKKYITFFLLDHLCKDLIGELVKYL